MKRLLAVVVPTAVLVLAGCGDTCTSNPAKATATNPSCSLAPGTTATISVGICGGCNDSSASCQADFTSSGLTVQPVVQQCQENAGCAVSGCSNLTAQCTVAVPADLSGDVTLTISGEQLLQGNVTIRADGGSSCAL